MSAYEQFLTSPEFAAAFTAAYAGRHEPADALWWLDHPTSDAPSGAQSPVSGIAELKQAAYARGADAASHESLARLEAEASADRQTTVDAVAVARMPPTVEASREAEDVTSALPLPKPRRRWKLVVGIAIIALLVGAAAGRQIGLADSRVILVGTPGPTVTQTISPFAPTDPAMLDIFDDAQEPEDLPKVAIDSVSAETVRLLGRYEADTVGGSFTLYAGEQLAGYTACLVMVFDDDRQVRACAPEQDMPAQGLSLMTQDGDIWALSTWSSNGRTEINGGSYSDPVD